MVRISWLSCCTNFWLSFDSLASGELFSVARCVIRDRWMPSAVNS